MQNCFSGNMNEANKYVTISNDLINFPRKILKIFPTHREQSYDHNESKRTAED